MAKILVLSFIATDRPGVIDRITKTVSDSGGNWLESRMAHLSEKFAGVARVSVSDTKATDLEIALADLEEEGFHLVIEATAEALPADGEIFALEFIGPDHPGILYEISHCLAEHEVSVESMRTELEAAPMGGGRLFHAKGRVRMPAGLAEVDLRNSLESLAEALMVDITLVEENE